MAKSSKPEPKPPGREEVLKWLWDYQRVIQEQDYEHAKLLFHQNVIGFETGKPRVDQLDALISQWQVLWPHRTKLEFLIKDTRVIPGSGMFAIATEWFVPSPIIGGHPTLGRSSFVLLDFNGKLLCVHAHNSLAP